MPRLTLTLALLLAPTLALAQSLSGLYDVWGRNLAGDVYTGTAEIRDTGAEIGFYWSTTAGSYSGSGTREGNILLVDWGSDYLIVYTVMDDGELHGTWADGYGLDRLSPR